MSDDDVKEAARRQVAELVAAFARNEADHLRSTYNETQARTDFITPLLEAFGWDIHNRQRLPLAFREVVEEATVEVGEERISKRPDYELRLARQRKFFVEAKKPSVPIDRDRAAAFQTRRYGYSASLPISVLTNFHQLAIYDCQHIPSETDQASVARILLVPYRDFETRFDELWALLSRAIVYSGEFDRTFAVGVSRHGADQFDDFFLRQVRSWRERLAVDIHANTPGLSTPQLTYAVQLFLSRIVFLRICEDREIERYETLHRLSAEGTFTALMAELQRADEFYNSGLFRLLDDAALGIRISDAVLFSIIDELYYPKSPYTFAVVETEVLGEIYEQFLGEVISIEDGQVVIVSKPEVRESGGVVPTPRYVVDAIVTRALLPALDRGPAEMGGFTVLDPCCGSGIFLLAVFEFLQAHYLSWYIDHDPAAHPEEVYEVAGGQWRLTLAAKRRILLTHVRGVDIDPNAVEVARFSLLLKLIEDESEPALREYVGRTHTRALPSLDSIIRVGNSLVRRTEWTAIAGAMSPPLALQINPFNWEDEFAGDHGRFDVIVANPPYIRIQNMAGYSPAETAFYQNTLSPYTTARSDNFDKYALFCERSISLLKPTGRLGVIIPNKFMDLRSGRPLRHLLSEGRYVEQIVRFGAQPVFGRAASNYTCILVMDIRGTEPVEIETVSNLKAWRYGQPGEFSAVRAAELTDEPWPFANAETRALIDRIRADHPNRLSGVADISVGLQTSADKIYIFSGAAADENTVTLRWNNRDWPIERGVLRPCLNDVRLQAYGRPEANAWMIFPYELVQGPRRLEARLIQPVDMRARFPGAMDYLEARQAELEKRQITGGALNEQQFYQFGRSQSLTKFSGEQVIVRVLTREAQYAFSDGSVVFTGGGNGPYYMVKPNDGSGHSTAYLLAVLNNPISEALVRTHTSVFRGGYYSHGKQFIEDLPIPESSPEQRLRVEALAVELANALDDVRAARTPHERTIASRQETDVRSRLEQLVTVLFGLDENDMAVIRAVEAPAA